jgi:carboxyvinyl-carboxyphosphonate phosphorylmutase
MTHHEQRLALREILAGTACVSPASVYDPVSARVAEGVGHRLGMLGGSVASTWTLAAPDVAVITLTELADEVRRIMRVVDKLSLFIDADHAYGNALNAMRTVEELEHAGASGFSIEDTRLPQSFGRPDGEPLLPIDEMVGKLKAAVAAKRDPALVIAGRTSAPKDEGMESALARAKAYAATGVDAIFLIGAKTAEDVAAVRAATGLPIIIGAAPAGVTREAMAAAGARIMLTGHQPIAATVKTLIDIYTHFMQGGTPAQFANRCATKEEMDRVMTADRWAARAKDYLGG